MVILNSTYSRITYSHLLIGWFSFFREILIWGRDIAVIFFSAALLDITVYLIFNKFPRIHNTIKKIFLLISACMFLADLFAIYYYQLPFNSEMLNVALMTNFREGSEFIQIYLSDLHFWLFFIAIGFILMLFMKIFRLILSNKILACFLLIICVSTGGWAAVREFRIGGGVHKIKSSIAPFRIASMLNDIHQSLQKTNEVMSRIPEVKITKNKSSIPYVIFVLGESTTRNHMSIYGYNLITSPNLAKCQNEGRLYVFNDVVSPHALTILSLQKIFTFYRYGSAGEWFTYANLFSILKEAGYYTMWLSNQEMSIGGIVTKFYSGLCEQRKFIEDFKDNITIAVTTDEAILPLLDKSLEIEHAKNFYLIHLIGTHFHYYKRYPKSFEKFYTQDEDKTGGLINMSVRQKILRAQYDNAILYNDFILGEIIKRFEDKNAIIIYISDHGEEIFDTMNLLGHNDGVLSPNVIEIPFIIWLSEKFAASYPELEARIASSVHKPYMTDDMIHTVLDIMQIETHGYDPAKSIINASFDITRPRIYSGHIYDKEKGLIAIQ